MRTQPGSIVETEDDPPPIVLILATTLRRSERTPKLAELMRRAKGTVALRSTVDPQAATIRFTDGRVRVERGVAADADVVIATDVNRMADEHPPKPKVTGAATHPRLALAVAKLLEPPTGTWQDEARVFWAKVEASGTGPSGLRIVCTDRRAEVGFGASPADFEIHGTEHRLLAMLSGNSVFGQEVFDGNLHAVGTLRHLAELTGVSIDLMMGR